MNSELTKDLISNFLGKIESNDFPSALVDRLKEILIAKGTITEDEIIGLIEECEPESD